MDVPLYTVFLIAAMVLIALGAVLLAGAVGCLTTRRPGR